MSGWFPLPAWRISQGWWWIARFECGHHTFVHRPMVESHFRYACPHCGWKYVTAVCKIGGPW